MSKWQEYIEGKCTDEEYIREEYKNCNYLGKVKNGIAYYIFKDTIDSNTYECYIHTFEDGHTAGGYFVEDMTCNEIFSWFYMNNECFKRYVDEHK